MDKIFNYCARRYIMTQRNLDWEELSRNPEAVRLTVTQPGLNTLTFEKAYQTAGIAYSFEFALFVQTTYHLSQKLGRNITILEVGVGTGRVGSFLYRLPWVRDYLGIDAEPTSIPRCNERDPNLPVQLVDLLRLSKEKRWDVVMVPFGTFSGVNKLFQEIMFLKILHHANHLVMIDTLIPEAFGSTEDTYYENSGEELGLPIKYIDWFASWRTYTKWVADYNTYNEQKISALYIEYPFLYQGKEKQDHQMVIIEKY
jgi:SAM-dependent methyltransferase